MIKVQQKASDAVKVLQFEGSLAQAETERLEPEFRGFLTAPKPRLVIDLSKVNVMTTPAISMFLSGAMQVKKGGGKMVFFAVKPSVIEGLLTRCRLENVLEIVHELDEATERARK